MQSHVAFDHTLAEPLKAFTFKSTKKSNNVSSNFEWRCFKIQKSRCKNKSKVDVYKASIVLIDQDIGIVSVFNLENVADKRICC